MSHEISTYKNRVNELQNKKIQLEKELAETQENLHQATVEALGSDLNQPLDQQAQKIWEFTQFHRADPPWFYATLNSIMRARMSHPSLSVNREFKIDIPDDQFKLSTDYDLKWALAHAYYGDSDIPSGIPEALKSLELGYQKWDKSERIYKFQYHPKRNSLVFQWLGENINTMAHFGELPFEERKKYLSEEELQQLRGK